MATEKRFDPTSRKLQKAREDGDVAKSSQLTTAIALTLGNVVIFSLWHGFLKAAQLWEKCLAAASDLTPTNMIGLLGEVCGTLVWIVGPVLAALVLGSLASEMFQVGVHFHFKNLAPKPSRLNIAEGFKRMLGYRGEGTALMGGLLSEVVKSVVVLVVLGFCLALATYQLMRTSPFIGLLDAKQLFLFTGVALVKVLAGIVLTMLAIGIIDLVIERKRRLKRLRMSAEEFKREFRETEGDPEVKGMRKQLAREILLQGLISGIRKAKVVVVGGTGR